MRWCDWISTTRRTGLPGWMSRRSSGPCRRSSQPVARTSITAKEPGSKDRDLHPATRAVIVHDYLNQYGGAERVLEAMRDMYPDAPLLTSMYDANAMPGSYRDWDIRPSWLDRIPGVHSHHQWALPLYPLVFRSLDDLEPDLVLSTSSAWAKGVRTPPGVGSRFLHPLTNEIRVGF